MATTGKQLGQLRPSDTTAASIYNSAASTATRITWLVICNTTAAAVTYRMFHDTDGTTYDETTALLFNSPLKANETLFIDMAAWEDTATGNFAVRTSVGNAITFTLYGMEQT